VVDNSPLSVDEQSHNLLLKELEFDQRLLELGHRLPMDLSMENLLLLQLDLALPQRLILIILLVRVLSQSMRSQKIMPGTCSCKKLSGIVALRRITQATVQPVALSVAILLQVL